MAWTKLTGRDYQDSVHTAEMLYSGREIRLTLKDKYGAAPKIHCAWPSIAGRLRALDISHTELHHSRCLAVRLRQARHDIDGHLRPTGTPNLVIVGRKLLGSRASTVVNP